MRWTGITARPREEGTYQGIVPTISGILRAKRNKNALRFARTMPCSACGGTRLRKEALSFVILGEIIAALSTRSLANLRAFFETADFRSAVHEIAAPIVSEMLSRIHVLEELGLGHLPLDRLASSLSSGEINRLRLATQLSGGLSGLMLVLDEPSVGLHPVDVHRLLSVLRRLRDQGNTLLVVERRTHQRMRSDPATRSRGDLQALRPG